MIKSKIQHHIDDFTEKHYRDLLLLALKKYHFASYENIPFGERFVLWRHDCDFSLNRALKLAQIEAEEGVAATYFIHPHSEFYNPFEKGQSKIIHEILELGHTIGLHFDAQYHELENDETLGKIIRFEASILRYYFGREPHAFSFHNPNDTSLSFEEEKYGGLVNCYSRRIKKEIPYCSDSNGYWRYRRLYEVLSAGEDNCLQVLTHPAWWQEMPMLPMERIARCISGRSEEIEKNYTENLSKMGRKNIGAKDKIP